MHRQLKNALLLGAMMIVAAAGARAQTPSAPAKVRHSYPFSVAVTANPMLDNSIADFTFWTMGGGAQLAWQPRQHFGIVADLSGTHTANINSTGVGLDLLTVTAGPRYIVSSKTGRFSAYGQVLGGMAHASNSVFPAVGGAHSTANSAAVLGGAGLNIALKPHLALRALEGDWLHTAFPNTTTKGQNSFRMSTGLVFYF